MTSYGGGDISRGLIGTLSDVMYHTLDFCYQSYYYVTLIVSLGPYTCTCMFVSRLNHPSKRELMIHSK